jgi:nucleoside-diphosphate-sugar epimerase
MTIIRKVFVTGANGFIGAHLVRRLLAEGYEVGFLKRETADISKIADLLARVRAFNGDIRDYSSVLQAVSDFQPDAVLHLVTYYRIEHTSADIRPMIDTNVLGTINLLEASRENGVKLFVNTSSCAVYRMTDHAVSEDDPIAPQNLYALTKHHAEEECRFYADYFGLNGITLRMFPPYGPGDHERRLIPHVILSLQKRQAPDLTTGNQRWDFVYIDDVIDAYIAALEKAPGITGHEVVNIGTGAPVSVREMVTKILNRMHTSVEPRFGAISHRKNEVWYNSAEIGKAGRLLGWRPKHSVDTGLEKTIEYFTKK